MYEYTYPTTQPYQISLIDSSESDALVTWQSAFDVEGEHQFYRVYLNGLLVKETEETSAVISGVRGGEHIELQVVPVSGPLEYTQDFANWVRVASYGNRIILAWNQDATCTGYEIYFSDDGTSPGDVLETLYGSNSTFFITDELTEDVIYKFRIRAFNDVGNYGGYSNTVSKSVNKFPEPVTGALVSYSSATRKATLTATKPAIQADTAGFVIYANHNPATGLQADVILDKQYRLATFLPSQTISFTTCNLFAGQWYFAIRTVDKSGLESDYETLPLHLELSAGTLVAILPKPSAPVLLSAIPIAGGYARVKVRIITEDYQTGIRIYADDSAVALIDIDENVNDYETDILLGNVTKTITATVINSEAESDHSNGIEITTDATGPAGTLTLTADLYK